MQQYCPFLEHMIVVFPFVFLFRNEEISIAIPLLDCSLPKMIYIYLV